MIEIVICTDDNYVMPSGVLLTSILMNSECPASVRIHLISERRLSDASRYSLDKIIEKYHSNIVYYNFPVSTHNLPCHEKWQSDHISVTAYMRLFIVDILPKDINKVIYLDCDVICRHDLSELWNEDIDEYAIGCCKEGNDDFGFYNNIKLEFELSYFNSGVQLINLSYWREKNVLRRCIDFAMEFPERCVWYDQDILNSVLRREKKLLHRKYNVSSSLLEKNRKLLWTDFDEVALALEDPVLIHFSGSSKPWNTISDDHPYRQVFRFYQFHTEWAKTMGKNMIIARWKFLRRIKRTLLSLVGRERESGYIELKVSLQR